MNRLILAMLLLTAAAGRAEADFNFWKGWFGPQSYNECISSYSEDVSFYRSLALIKQACQVIFPVSGDSQTGAVYSREWAECILDEIPDIGSMKDEQALQLTLNRTISGCERLDD